MLRANHFKNIYNAVRKVVVRKRCSNVFWTGSLCEEAKRFVVYVEDFSDKTATTLKNVALVVCIVHVMLANVYVKF